MNFCHPLTDLDETFTQVRHWVSAKNLLLKSFPSHPIPKNMAWEKFQIYVNLSNTAVSQMHVTSKRLNKSTNDYHNVSSRINALENGTKLVAEKPFGVAPRVFLQPQEKRC